MDNKVAAISYSWDNEDHKEWVLNLANNLVRNGVDILLDQYDLSAGKDMTYFMEKAMAADKVLVVLTPNYKLKADNREGGVGYEYSLLTKEYYEKEPDKTRILPVMRLGDDKLSCPSFMGTKIFHDMRNDTIFDAKFFELIKLILDKPLIKKPPLGKLPSFDDHSIPDIDKTILDFKHKEDFFNKKMSIIRSMEGVKIFNEEIRKVYDQISEAIQNYSSNFGIHFSQSRNPHRKNILFSTINYTFSFIPELRYRNSAHEANVELNFYKGPYGLQDRLFPNDVEIKIIYETRYDFDLDENLAPIFIRSDNKNIKLTSHDIATIALREVVVNEIKFRESQLK